MFSLQVMRLDFATFLGKLPVLETIKYDFLLWREHNTFCEFLILGRIAFSSNFPNGNDKKNCWGDTVHVREITVCWLWLNMDEIWRYMCSTGHDVL